MYNGRNYRSIFAGVDINVQATEESIIVEIIEVFYACVDINVQATDVRIIKYIVGVLINAGVHINVQATDVNKIEKNNRSSY